MQFQINLEKTPHYHHLKPVSSLNQGDFYFRDDGILFVGDDEWTVKEVQATLGLPYKILFEDLQDAFRLGLAVGALRQLDHSECET